jgi:regulator of telomere elongation helicase 1
MIEKAKSMSADEVHQYIKTVPYIFYSSRTHSQLSNVIKELRKTCYAPKTSILSSRDNMCVNAAVKNYSGNFLNIKCKQVRIKKECKYFFGAEKLPKKSYDNTDIEELYSLGQKSMFCPFYFQRNKKDIADIIFLPYNYIFEPKLRKILKLDLKNSVILIDEAHNIESVAENAKSCEFSLKMIDDCLNDFKSLKILVENLTKRPSEESVFRSITTSKIGEQEGFLNNIKLYLKSFTVKQGTSWPNYGYKLTAKEFFDIFFEGSKRQNGENTIQINNDNQNKAGITPENIEQHISFLKKIETGIADELLKNTIITNLIEILELVYILSKNYLNCLKTGDTNPNNCFINNYKIFLNDIEEFVPGNVYNHNSKQNVKIRTLFVYCFNPGFGFKDIIDAKPNSVIITSGTLSPIEGVESELKCNFNIKLENKHVIDTCQVNFAILTNSVRRKIPFRFDINSRNNLEMIQELGHTIADLCKITPGGILAFFTSYNFLHNCISQWTEKDILCEIEKNKEIFKEVQDSNKNKVVLKNFTETCSSKINKKGGILFSVCRGTSSEGIDFSDDMARMVIVVGIPYPNLGDVKVNLKKEYLDDFNNKYFQHLDKKIAIRKLTSQEWYTQSATRAVNQALGRVIRHVNDYGSMILIDSRYQELLYKKMFSAWLRDSAKIYDDSKCIVDTKNFNESMKRKKFL